MNEGPSLGSRLGAAFIVISGFVAFPVAAFFFRHSHAARVGMVIALVGYFWCVLSITAFFHRGLTHESVRFKWWFEKFAILTGAFAAIQGTAKFWTTTHRKHHQHADKEGDPHSPHRYGDGFWAMCRGLVHAHFGWFFVEPEPDFKRYMPPRFKKDPRLEKLDRWFMPVVVASFIVPGIIELMLVHAWAGFFYGVLWGGFIRMFAVHHATWSVNSSGHSIGTRPNKTGDMSTNNALMAVLTCGESLHNNHHNKQKSANFSRHWWQLDPGYWFIKICSWLKLATIVGEVESKELTLG